MKQPSWRLPGEGGAALDVSDCDPFLLMTALRGLPIILVDIARSEQVFFPDNAQDVEFVAAKLDQLITELQCRLVASGKFPNKPAQRSNHSGNSDTSRPKEKRRTRMPDGSLGFKK